MVLCLHELMSHVFWVFLFLFSCKNPNWNVCLYMLFSFMNWWNVSVHVALYIGALVTNILVWLFSATEMWSHKHYNWMVLCLHELMSRVISNCFLENNSSYIILIEIHTYIVWISKVFFSSWTDEMCLFMSLFILVL